MYSVYSSAVGGGVDAWAGGGSWRREERSTDAVLLSKNMVAWRLSVCGSLVFGVACVQRRDGARRGWWHQACGS